MATSRQTAWEVKREKREEGRETLAGRKGGRHRSITDKHVSVGQEFSFVLATTERGGNPLLPQTCVQTMGKRPCGKNASEGDTGLRIQADLERRVSGVLPLPSPEQADPRSFVSLTQQTLINTVSNTEAFGTNSAWLTEMVKCTS